MSSPRYVSPGPRAYDALDSRRGPNSPVFIVKVTWTVKKKKKKTFPNFPYRRKNKTNGFIRPTT